MGWEGRGGKEGAAQTPPLPRHALALSFAPGPLTACLVGQAFDLPAAAPARGRRPGEAAARGWLGGRALVVRKRLEPTAGRRSTRSSAAAAVVPSGKASGAVGSGLRSNLRPVKHAREQGVRRQGAGRGEEVGSMRSDCAAGGTGRAGEQAGTRHTQLQHPQAGRRATAQHPAPTTLQHPQRCSTHNAAAPTQAGQHPQSGSTHKGRPAPA